LKPKRVTKTDPEVDFQNKSIDETLTGEKLATKVVLEERRAAVTNNDSPVP
jgi:sulfur carrier protein ThiS